MLVLQSLGLGCHVGLTYAGALGYADDIALVAPSINSLTKNYYNMRRIYQLSWWRVAQIPIDTAELEVPGDGV